MNFLTADDLITLTGFKRAAAQMRWLAERGYRFDVNGKGKPVVLRAAVEAKLGSSEQRRIEPRWDRVGA